MDSTMICPHCRSEIPRGANVCRGCHAEIKYAAPGFFILVGVIAPIFAAAWLLDFFHIKNESLSWIIGLPIAIAGWGLFIFLKNKFYPDHVRFFRRVKY